MTMTFTKHSATRRRMAETHNKLGSKISLLANSVVMYFSWNFVSLRFSTWIFVLDGARWRLPGGAILRYCTWICFLHCARLHDEKCSLKNIYKKFSWSFVQIIHILFSCVSALFIFFLFSRLMKSYSDSVLRYSKPMYKLWNLYFIWKNFWLESKSTWKCRFMKLIQRQKSISFHSIFR